MTKYIVWVGISVGVMIGCAIGGVPFNPWGWYCVGFFYGGLGLMILWNLFDEKISKAFKILLDYLKF